MKFTFQAFSVMLLGNFSFVVGDPDPIGLLRRDLQGADSQAKLRGGGSENGNVLPGQGQGENKGRGREKTQKQKSGEEVCAAGKCDAGTQCQVNANGRPQCICPSGEEVLPGMICPQESVCAASPCAALGDDLTCLVKDDGTAMCLCPDGTPDIPGISCSELEAEMNVQFASDDEGCDPEAMKCGKGASCVIHDDKPVCICPGQGSVAHFFDCPEELAEEESETRDLEADKADIQQRMLGTVCADTPGWVNNYGLNCAWHEFVDSPGCPFYGAVFGNANANCCYCGGGTVVETDSISVIFISDLENSYRGHRDDWCKNIVSYIKNIGSEGFYYSTGMKVTADLVIHGGDLSDTTYGTWKDNWYDFLTGEGFSEPDEYIMDYIWQQLYDAGIPFISASGNHDTPNPSGSNEKPVPEAKRFVETSFKKAQTLKPNDFVYEKFSSDIDGESDYYMAEYKGIQIGTVNDELSSGSGSQWTDFQASFDKSKPTLFFSHRPIRTQEYAFRSFVDDFPSGTAHFSGHTHEKDTNTIGSSSLTDYTAPYPHPWDRDDTNSPGFLAVNVSPTTGIIQVKPIKFDYQSVTGCWKAGDLCGLGTTCDKCCPGEEESYWYGKAMTACGTEPCWSDGRICGLGTTCNACCNGNEWWTSTFFTTCGQEPCWGSGTVCGTGTTCHECCSGNGGAKCPWYQFGVCTCG